MKPHHNSINRHNSINNKKNLAFKFKYPVCLLKWSMFYDEFDF